METSLILTIALFVFSLMITIIGYLVKRAINGLQYYLDEIRDKLEEISLTLSKTITEVKLHNSEITHIQTDCKSKHSHIDEKLCKIEDRIGMLTEFKIKQENK